MKTIILGKDKPATLDSDKGEVYQPFSYKTQQTGVSRKHATITIDDNGYWWLEDRWSTNGTYIREDDGNFRKIGNREQPGKCRITPMTFVKLGIDDPTCCCFYAKQVDSYGNFNEEFEYIQEQIEKISNDGEKQLKMLKIQKMIIRIFPSLLVGLWILSDYLIKGAISMEGTMIRILIPPVISATIEFFYTPNDKKKRVEKEIKEKKKDFSQCPNPMCNHSLSEAEVALMKCNSCNIQHN